MLLSATVPLTANGGLKVNAPPTAVSPENGSVTFEIGDAISITDNSAGTNPDLLTVSVSHGTVTLGSTNGLTFTSGSDGSPSLTVSGTVTELNAALNNLTYTPTANYVGSEALAIQASDPGDGASGSNGVAITVSPLAPIITAPTSASASIGGSLTFSPPTATRSASPIPARETTESIGWVWASTTDC